MISRGNPPFGAVGLPMIASGRRSIASLSVMPVQAPLAITDWPWSTVSGRSASSHDSPISAFVGRFFPRRARFRPPQTLSLRIGLNKRG